MLWRSRPRLLEFLFTFWNGSHLKRKNKYFRGGEKAWLVIAFDLEEFEN